MSDENTMQAPCVHDGLSEHTRGPRDLDARGGPPPSAARTPPERGVALSVLWWLEGDGATKSPEERSSP